MVEVIRDFCFRPGVVLPLKMLMTMLSSNVGKEKGFHQLKLMFLERSSCLPNVCYSVYHYCKDPGVQDVFVSSKRLFEVMLCSFNCFQTY